MRWQDAFAANAVEPALAYIDAYRAGRFATAAASRVDDLRWAHAERLNTVDGYHQYLRDQAEGQYRDRAAHQIDGLLWMQATHEDSTDAYQRYLLEQPGGQFRETAATRIEDLTWEAAVRTGTRDALEAVLARWPAGRHVQEARARIDDLQWRAAVSRGTLRAYREYLRTAERGLHAAEARARISALPAPLPNMAYAGQTEHHGVVRLVIGPGSAITSAWISLRGIDPPERPNCRLIVWQEDPRRGMSSSDYPDIAIPTDDLPLPIRDSRITYTPERPRTVPAVLSGGSLAFRIDPNPLQPGPSVTMQLVQVAMRGQFRADRLEGTIQPVFPGLSGCDGPAVPFSAVAVEP